MTGAQEPDGPAGGGRDESPDSAARKRRRLAIAYAAAAVLAVGGGALVLALSSGGEEDDDAADAAAAGVDLRTGIIDGKELDTRSGTQPPAPAGAGDLARRAEAAGCELVEDLRDEGNTHVPPGSPAPEYATIPAASGDHYPDPQADGAYREPISPLRYIHALEHGRVAIAYDPELPEPEQLELKGLFDEDPGAILLFPDPGMEHTVAAVAWTRILSCDAYRGEPTIRALRGFRERWRGRGPERLAY